MKLTFKGGVTELGRKYILCKELDVIATFENRVSSVNIQVEDTINKQGIIVVGVVDRENGVVLSVKTSSSLATPQNWTYCNKINPLTNEITLEVDNLPDGANSLKVKEV